MANVVDILVTGKNIATPAFESATADAKGLSGTMGKMGALSSAALIGVGVEATKMAVTYESATTRLVTSAGETTSNLGKVKQGMLDMAGQVGISATDLAKGMYTVESAGFHGAAGLTVLKAAAQGAKDENADLATVSNAVTDVLVDYHLKASDAADVTSKMVTAVSFGKTTFQDFSGALSNILPLASSVHLKFQDVSGVLAEMTAHGMSADRASQDEANAMRELISPTGAMTKEFTLLGISSQDVSKHLSQDGLAGTMQWLSTVAEDGSKKVGQNYTEALKKLMGTAPGLATALMTTGENAKATDAAIAGIGSSSTDAAGNVKGFSDVQQTLGQRLSELNAGFQSLMIELGQKLIPVVTDIVAAMSKHKDVVILLVAVTATLIASFITYSVVMKTIAVVQGIVTVATKAWAAAQWLLNAAMDANPIMIVVIAIGALVTAVILCYQHFTSFRNVVNDVLKWFSGPFVDGFKDVGKWFAGPFVAFFDGVGKWFTVTLPKYFRDAGTAIEGVIKGWYPVILGILSGGILLVPALIYKYWSQISGFIQQAWNNAIDWMKGIPGMIIGIFADAGTWLYNAGVQLVQGMINGIQNMAGSLISTASNLGSDVLNSVGSFFSSLNPFAHGGIVGAAATGGPRGNLVMVGEHGPEMVRLPYGSAVRSNPDTMSMLTTGASSSQGASGATNVEVVFSGNTDTAFATAFMLMMRTGKIQIKQSQLVTGR